METVEIIDSTLKQKLAAEHVAIIDESHKHRGHKAAGGGGHYQVVVVSPKLGVKTIKEFIIILSRKNLVRWLA